MAKRFTDNSKWADEWFSELSPQNKLAWLYILDHCDSVGVWKPNFRLANFQLGFEIDWTEFRNLCGDARILLMENTCWWIIKFCDYQYGTLKEDSKSQTTKYYINLLQKHGLYNYKIKQPKKEKTLFTSEPKLADVAIREELFKETLRPFIGEHPKQRIIEFFNYWSEKTKAGNKMRFELQKTWEVKKRLAIWAKNENDKINNNGKQTRKGQSDTTEADELADRILAEHARNKEHGASNNE